MAADESVAGQSNLFGAGASLTGLLDAFAEGREVPGSGSANALIAAVAAAMTESVAGKTSTSSQMRYRPVQQLAASVAKRCRTIRVELQELAARDMEVFAPVVAIRREARTLVEKYQQDQAKRREIAATKPATELPIRVAALALEVGDMAASMVNQGFQAARGESYTALAAAVAALDGALFVARLNVGTIRQRILDLNDPQLERFWLESTTTKIRELRLASRALRLHEIKSRRASETTMARPTRRQQKKNSIKA